MGIAFTSPGGDAFDEGLEALIMRSISFNGDDDKAPLKSFSFNGRDTEPSVLKAFGSGKLIIEGSLNLDRKEMEISIKSPASEKNSLSLAGFKKSRFSHLCDTVQQSPVCDNDGSEHQAALKLQKFYKSFRTRRQLADCAVLVEQRWWKLLDFAMLRRSSISFFDIEKPESAVSRWSRARTRAAKVGKGLSKDEKAQKLARQHWLEAIDPRHRYGHNLYFYYDCWLQCESKQPFFYWLDVGEGKELNLEEQCPRSKLQKQCIKYLGPNEREKYEVIVEDRKFLYKISRQFLDTSDSPKGTKWIFVLSTAKALYVGQKKKGAFQHSSFLAGGATSSAGRLVVEKGILKAVWPHSGHYRPTEKNFLEFMNFLKENNVDLTDVKKSPAEDDKESGSWVRSNTFMTSKGSEEDLTKESFLSEEVENGQMKYRHPAGLANIEIPERLDLFSGCNAMAMNFGNIPIGSIFGRGEKISKRSSQMGEQCSKPNKQQKVNNNKEDNEGSSDDETNARTSVEESEEVEGPCTCILKQNLFDGHDIEKDFVPQELIFNRINGKNGFNPCQFGKKMPFRWTTGAGPRIGCVRDYPPPLQHSALEQVNLSPRGTGDSGQIPASPCSQLTEMSSCLRHKELQRDH